MGNLLQEIVEKLSRWELVEKWFLEVQRRLGRQPNIRILMSGPITTKQSLSLNRWIGLHGRSVMKTGKIWFGGQVSGGGGASAVEG